MSDQAPVTGGPVPTCPICGDTGLTHSPILWDELINEWQLSPDEARYIDAQQGTSCVACGSNLRSMALARAITMSLPQPGLLRDAGGLPENRALRILEVNRSGSLTPWLSAFQGHQLVEYPDVDIHALPFAAFSFDLVVHSDTLEHVANPIHALTECLRVLRPTGACVFTVPIVVGRMSRSRAGLMPSFHGNPYESGADLRVVTEFGADVWTFVAEAGFASITISMISYPQALAVTARP